MFLRLFKFFCGQNLDFFSFECFLCVCVCACVCRGGGGGIGVLLLGMQSCMKLAEASYQ